MLEYLGVSVSKGAEDVIELCEINIWLSFMISSYDTTLGNICV